MTTLHAAIIDNLNAAIMGNLNAAIMDNLGGIVSLVRKSKGTAPRRVIYLKHTEQCFHNTFCYCLGQIYHFIDKQEHLTRFSKY